MLKFLSSCRPIWLIGPLALATAVLHCCFGVHYATHAENLVCKPTLHMQGEEYLRSFPGWGVAWENDAAAYNRAAIGVLQTGVPRNRTGGVSVHALVYDYFLAACYWVGGVRLLAVAIPQGLLAGLTCLLVGLAAWRIAAPQTAALAGSLAALIMFANLRLAIYVGNMLPTVVLLFLFSIALAAAAGPRTPGRLSLFVLAIGLGIFTQAGDFVIATAAALWLALESIRAKDTAMRYGCVVILLLIGIRLALPMLNFGGQQDDGWRKTDSGGILWEANNPYYESMRLTDLWERRPGNPWTKWKMSPPEDQRFNDYLARAHQDERTAAILWIRENPAQYAKLCCIRLRTEWGPCTAMMSPRNRLISAVYWLLIFPAGLWGLWQTRDRPLSRLVGWVMLAIFAFGALVFVEWYLRYRLPVDLALTVYAGVAYGRFIAAGTKARAAGAESPG